MLIRRKFLWPLLMMALLTASAILLSFTGTLAQKSKVTNQEPTVESSASESSDAKRQAKGRRYDRAKSGPILELGPDVDELPLNGHWFMGIPALPIAQSDVSRSTVYSEFSVYIDDVLKNSSGPQTLNAGATIIVERLGGAVRFPSGKVQHYQVSRQGLPQTGEKYVLFLKCNGEDYDIVTGYWVNAGQVSPLDGHGDLPFGKYEGKTVDSFLSELRNAIDTSLPKGAGVK